LEGGGINLRRSSPKANHVSYLPDPIRQIRTYLPDPIRQIRTYLPEPQNFSKFQKIIIRQVAQLGAAPKVLKFLKSVQYIQRYHLLKYPVNPTLSALHCWEIAGKQG